VPPGAARNEQALLTISDTGVGMDEEMQSRIFDPFYTTKALPGTPGLGLSMVQGIIAQSGGTVITESAPGRGSTFKVFLPIAGESAVRKP
jgi:signal transduction histidine kinase